MKSLAIIAKYCNLNSIVMYTKPAKPFLLRDERISLKPFLKTIGICYYAIVLKEEKKKHKNWPLKKRLWKGILSNKQNNGDNIIS